MNRKERLEQMKELGRSGVNRGLMSGLTFLRTASSAAQAAPATSPQLQEDAVPSANTANTVNNESANAQQERMSYDDLVSLSVKLTRQNKLMRTQLQKVQSQRKESLTESGDAPVLVDFLEKVVGLDITSCRKQVDGEGEDDEPSLPLDKEKLIQQYTDQEASKQKVHEREVSLLQEELEGYRASSSFHSSTVKSEQPPSFDSYDEIDLLTGDSTPKKPAMTLDQIPNSTDLSMQLSEAKAEIERLKQRLEQQESVVSPESGNELVHVSYDDDASTMQSADADDKSDVVKQLESEKESLRAQIDLMNMEWQEQQTELERLQQQLEEVQHNSNAAESHDATDLSLQDEIKHLKEELEHVKAENDRLVVNAGATDSDATLQSIQDERDKLESKAEELEFELSTMRDQLQSSTSKEEVEALKNQVSKLERSKQTLEEELSILREENGNNLTSVLNDLEEYKDQVKQLTSDKEALESRLSDADESASTRAAALGEELEVAFKAKEELEKKLVEKEKQVEKMSSSQSALTDQTMELERQVASMTQDLAMASKGMEAHADKSEESERRCKELEDKIEQLHGQHRDDIEMLRTEKDAETERVRLEKDDALGQLTTVKASLKNEQDKANSLEKQVQDLEQTTSRLESELKETTKELADTKKSLSDRVAWATRLQNENMGIAGKQAEQAALIESAHRDAEKCREQMHEAQDKVKSMSMEMERAKKVKEDASAEMTRLQKEVEAQRQLVLDARKETESQVRAAVESEREAFERQRQRIEADGKNRSKMARQAVQEKDEEIQQLRSRLVELEEDVRSGGADNRKILEFAQLQAKREADSRNKAVQLQTLSQQVEAARRKIKELEAEKHKYDQQLQEVMRSQRRDGVNLEYLKNVVVQFVSFKPGSSEQGRLVPVISKLLEFTPADVREIKKASEERRNSSWGGWAIDRVEFQPIAASYEPEEGDRK